MVSIAIKKEEKELERRTPLIPEDIEFLKRKFNLDSFVETSNQRIYPDSEFNNKGAVLEEKLQSKGDFIIALNEIPMESIRKGKKYVIFTHILKNQEKVFPLLKKIIQSKSTLIDLEKITDNKNKSLFNFDKFIGYAGMIDSFWALGQKLKVQGLETPLLKINQAFKYKNLDNAMDLLKKIGKEIDIIGLNYPDGPLIIGIIGIGAISTSVQEIINCIPCQETKPEELEEFFESGFYSENRIYYVVFQEKHIVKPIELEDDFDLQDYYTNPEKYETQFDKYIPYLTIIVNTLHRESKHPRYITKESLKELYEGGLSILRIIGDLSGDINGFIELTTRRTTSNEPIFTFDLSTQKSESNFSGKGPTILAIDNLSNEFPMEASRYFSNILKDFLPKITNANYLTNFQECGLPEEVKKGVVIYKGELTSNFMVLNNFLK